MKKILVKCTIEIPVEVPEDDNYDMYFDIEDNHCPGTGIVGTAIEKVIKDGKENNWCWACALNGKNEIILSPLSTPNEK